MEHYFILLELPGGRELKFSVGNKSPTDFWRNTVRSIRKGRAKLICRRQDTGLSEALRKYMLRANHFTTFLFADLKMKRSESCDKKVIMDKTVASITNTEHETVIDTNLDFQLITVDEHATLPLNKQVLTK